VTPLYWQQVNEILESAWAREPACRSVFLDQACGGDADLRAHVQALLESDENSADFLGVAIANGVSQIAFVHAIDELHQNPAEDSDLIGTRIGRYTIEALIGKGGMGAVYRAVREDDFRMQVAIKLLKRGTDTEAALRRFRAERQILARLQHPNIPRMLDGGATEAGLPYFVMEYVDGTPLLQYSALRSVRQRLQLFRQVCSAVQYAHQKLIVHRDIKPSNILVTTEGNPQLLDFGIAKLLDPADDRSLGSLTTTGMRLMTPDYASPEQLRGQPVTPATDVYSLGAVLYELLTGRPAQRIQSSSLAQIQKEICDIDPRKPSELVKELDPDLDNIVLKALRKEPERRYASVQELADDIERLLNDMPVQARSEPRLYRCRKFLKRNRVHAMMAGLSIVGVLNFGASLGLFTRQGGRSEVHSIAVLPLENLSHDPQQEQLADGMTDALIAALSKIKSLRVTSRDSAMVYKNAHKPALLIARELGTKTLTEGSVVRSGDLVRVAIRLRTGSTGRVRWAQTYTRNIQELPALHSNAAIAIAREIQIGLTPQEEALVSNERSVSQQAYEAYLRGRYQLYKHTHDGLQKSIEYFKEAIDIDPAYAPAWAGLADGYYEMSGAILPPGDAMPKARSAALKAVAIDPTLAEPYATLAQIQAQYDWDWTASEASYKRALKLNPSHAQGHLYYAWYLAEQGRIQEAIPEADEAYRLDPLPPTRATNAAWFYYLARRIDEAITRLRQILSLDPNAAIAHQSLGLAYEQKGMLEQAAAEFQKAGTADMDETAWLFSLGHVYAVAGKRDQARQILDQLQERSKQRYVNAYYPGLIRLALGEKDRAFAWFEKALLDRSEELLFLKVDPRLDSVRSDPRYSSLVRRIGLPR
jgi:serine/threonine protein kinase/Tfp pilus assembly protein PilF